LAKHLRANIRGEVYVAPAEADPQLVVFQNIHLRAGMNVYVYANDSDLLVHGVEQLLIEVSAYRGVLTGRCIKASLLFAPTSWTLSRDSVEHGFLRQLHGLPKDANCLVPGAVLHPLPEATARYRLLIFALLAGNDYANFEGIGPVTAAKLVLAPVQLYPEGVSGAFYQFDDFAAELAERIVDDARYGSGHEARHAALLNVEAKLRKGHNMFKHAKVWDPITGRLRHASGVRSTEYLTIHTGEMSLSPQATRIAWGDADAQNGQEWDPPLEEARAFAQPRSSRVRGGAGGTRKRTPPPGASSVSPPLPEPTPARQKKAPASHDTNNYATNGFNRLPEAGERYSDWTVLQLREFLSVFRCLDNAGTSGYNKPLLITLAAEIVSLIRKSGQLGDNLAFRHPVPDLRPFEEKEKMLMPDLPAQPLRITEWVAMRRYLPEISKSLILGFLQEVNPLAAEGTRVWYRGEQRVLDMGNLNRFWAVPSKDGKMWLGTRRV
ncbi:unnamed protein product, partial [Scytosiphon promiscuus]